MWPDYPCLYDVQAASFQSRDVRQLTMEERLYMRTTLQHRHNFIKHECSYSYCNNYFELCFCHKETLLWKEFKKKHIRRNVQIFHVIFWYNLLCNQATWWIGHVVSSTSFSPMRWNAARIIGWTNNLAWPPFAVIELVLTCRALGRGTADMFTQWQPRSRPTVCSVVHDVFKKIATNIDCIMCAQCYIFCQAFQRVTMLT